MENGNRNKDFAAWFNRKWAEWDTKEERRTTQQELAAYLDISRSAIAQYVSRRQIPEGQNLANIAKRFGPEIYEILGLPVPELDIPPEFSALEDLVRSSVRAAGVPMGSPEAAKIVISIVSEWLSSRKQSE